VLGNGAFELAGVLGRAHGHAVECQNAVRNQKFGELGIGCGDDEIVPHTQDRGGAESVGLGLKNASKELSGFCFGTEEVLLCIGKNRLPFAGVNDCPPPLGGESDGVFDECPRDDHGQNVLGMSMVR